MTPKDLSDTDKKLHAVAEEAGAIGARKALSDRTPTPHESAGQMYKIAEEVNEREEPSHMRRCENDPSGPARKLSKRLDDMEGRIEIMEKAREREEGGRQLRTRLFSGLAVLGVLSGIASGWYGATHRPAPVATVDVAAEIQALRAELKQAAQAGAKLP